MNVLWLAVASAFGLEYGRRKAEYACIKHFISLDHSPIKSTLVDMYVPFNFSVLSFMLSVLLSYNSCSFSL
jgi:hypothetical protein